MQPVQLVVPKPLIVFDLDKTLILRRDKKVILRKGALEIIEHVLSKYQGAIFTSITKVNLNYIIKYIFTKDQLGEFQFIWDRDFTEPDIEGVNPWDTIKKTNKIREYFPDRFDKIILVDDDVRKVRFNPDNEVVIVPKFEDPYENYNLKELISIIENKLKQ